MRRRINSTGRIKIPQQDMQLAFVDEANGCRVTGSVNIKNFQDLPDSMIEFRMKMGIYYDSLKYFDACESVAINELYEGLSADQKLTAEVTVYPLADPLATISRSGKFSQVIGDMQGLIAPYRGEFEYPLWKLKLDSINDDGVLILVSTKVLDYNAFVMRPDFIALVAPDVLGQVLKSILIDNEYNRHYANGSENDDKWIKFAFQLEGSPMYELNADDDQKMDWIEQIIEVFTRDAIASRGGLDLYIDQGNEEEGE